MVERLYGKAIPPMRRQADTQRQAHAGGRVKRAARHRRRIRRIRERLLAVDRIFLYRRLFVALSLLLTLGAVTYTRLGGQEQRHVADSAGCTHVRTHKEVAQEAASRI